MLLPAGDSSTSVHADNINGMLYEGTWFELIEEKLAVALFARYCATSVVGDRSRFFDIGSNTGYYSALAIAHGCHATTVDGSRDVLLYFEATRALNSWPVEVSTIVNRVVSDQHAGALTFDGWSTATGSSSLKRAVEMDHANESGIALNEYASQTPVRLDKLIGMRPVFFLKVDVESNEPDVFRSGNTLFESGIQVLNVLFEFTYVLPNDSRDLRTAYHDSVFAPLWAGGYECFVTTQPKYRFDKSNIEPWLDSTIASCKANHPNNACGVNVWCTLHDADALP